jgi:formylglycine-generating enzyme required for sulfatase activity
MNAAFALSLLLLAAEPTPEQLALLKTFRQEFVSITPGEGEFPKSFVMGQTAPGKIEEPFAYQAGSQLVPGKPSPPHRVTFDYDFAIAKYEVPQNLWQAVMGVNPSRWKGPRNSVELLSFDEANQFCERVTGLLRSAKLIDADEVVRLPTEAEWEYAARAGSDSAYSFGDDEARLDDYGWHTGNAAGNDPPVGAKKPNPWGLYDMHGYLWEWCADVWHGDCQGAPTDGSAWTTGGQPTMRVLRSGSWKDPALRLTSRYRLGAAKSLRDDAVGLRCVLASR